MKIKMRQIELWEEKLVQIQQNPDEAKRKEELKELAKEVGAGTENTKIAGISANEGGIYTQSNTISESELVQNIHNALQTKTIIITCKASNKNVWIAIFAAIAAFLSAAAAWVAVLYN